MARAIGSLILIPTLNLAVVGCGQGSPDPLTISAGAPETEGSSAEDAESGTTTEDSESTSEDTGNTGDEPVYDVAAPDLGTDTDGCEGIDFLFVIDNSVSMSQQQTQLVQSFSGFIEAIGESLDHVGSYHVGVITSDAYEYNEPACAQLGGLVTRTGGPDSSEQDCGPFAAGQRFVTEEDDLASAFECVARVGTTGDTAERPVSALTRALTPPLSDPGGCNDGFLRDDAILVVVIVTDDPPYPGTIDDAYPFTDPELWADEVFSAKHGDPSGVVVIGFVPWGELSCVCPWCCPGPGCNEPSENLIGFVDSFDERGILASVCESDYGPIFADAIETIDATCRDFAPPD